ncbi:hypothetical protein [Methylomonas albis]|uniref:Uncharacterized protein n=1 Tax=Methylomonas albis TaxID=1854563 RepID=A0ABR9D1W3_9GAMM|nr:hypothetical protein [Methylomonas albis]MBD9357109.1 hypothetical protein [Methylomonas albis]
MAPSIRRQIVAHLHHGGVGMKATVLQAVGLLKEATEYREQRSQLEHSKSYEE